MHKTNSHRRRRERSLSFASAFSRRFSFFRLKSDLFGWYAVGRSLVRELRQLVREIGAEHGLSCVKSTGDGFLLTYRHDESAEIAAVDALQASFELLRRLSARNDKVPEERQIAIRVPERANSSLMSVMPGPLAATRIPSPLTLPPCNTAPGIATGMARLDCQLVLIYAEAFSRQLFSRTRFENTGKTIVMSAGRQVRFLKSSVCHKGADSPKF
jgi:hypothetical protein